LRLFVKTLQVVKYLELDKLKTLVLQSAEKEPVALVRCTLDQFYSKIASQKICDVDDFIEILKILGNLLCLTENWDANDISGFPLVLDLCNGIETNIESAQLIRQLKLNVHAIDLAKSKRIESNNWQNAILNENKAFLERRKLASKAIEDVFAAYYCKIACQKIVQSHLTQFEGRATIFSTIGQETDFYVYYMLENEDFFCIVADVVFRHLSAAPYLENGGFKDWLLRIIQPRTNFAQLVRYRKVYGQDEVDDLFVMLESCKPQATETELLKYIAPFAAEHCVSSLINSSIPVGCQKFHSNIFHHHKDEEAFGVVFADRFYLIYTSTIFLSGFKIKTDVPETLKIKFKKDFNGILFCDAHLSADGKLFVCIVNYVDSDEFNSLKSNFMPVGETFICIPYKFIAEKIDNRALFFATINQTDAAAMDSKVEKTSTIYPNILNGLKSLYKTIRSPFAHYPIHAAIVSTFLLIISISTLFMLQNQLSVQSVALLPRQSNIQFRGLENIFQKGRIEQSGHHLSSGQSFQFQYELKKNRYVLVVFINSLNQHNVLLDEKQIKGIHTLPSEHSAYQLDNVPGTEYVYILTSKKTIPAQSAIELLKAADLDAFKRKGIDVQHISFVHTP
jgi:hypothetical protein